MKDDLATRLAEAFPTAGATASGTELLFARDVGPQHDLSPLTWPEVAERINEVADYSLISSMMPGDFRYYLPGLILGIACYEQDASSPMGSTVFFNLYDYSNPHHWDERFLDRWCRFTEDQYEVLEAALPPLLVEHLGAFNGAIATETLALARIQAADMVSNGK